MKQLIDNSLAHFSESSACLHSLWMLILVKFEQDFCHLTVSLLLKEQVKRTKIGKDKQNQLNSAITNHFVVLNHRVTSCNSFLALSVSTHKLLQ